MALAALEILLGVTMIVLGTIVARWVTPPPRALRVFRAILTVALVLTVMGALGFLLILTPAMRGAGVPTLSVPVEYPGDPRVLPPGSTGSTTPDGTSYTYHGRGSVRVRLVDPPSRIAAYAWVIGITAAVIVSLTKLRRIAETAVHGEPFAPDNISRLRVVGWIAVLAGLLTPFLLYATRSYLLDTVDLGPVQAQVPLPSLVDLRFFLPGVAVLALAEVFKRGTDLREQEALTI